MATLAAAAPAPITQPSRYAEPVAGMEAYFAAVRKQEERYVAAGFPADGVTDFLIRWWDAWTSMSMEKFRDTVTDDLISADPMTRNLPIPFTQTEIDLWATLLRTIHRNAYYRPIGTDWHSLPTWDFQDGQVRLGLVYEIGGRIWPLNEGRVEAHDRYTLVRDPERGWLISRIDTNGDGASLVLPMLGLPLPPSPEAVRRALRIAQRVFPGLRGPQVRPFTADESGPA